MASSYSDLGLELMVTGENAGTWGDKTNTNLNLINQVAAGYESIALSDGGTVTLALTDGAVSNARNMILKFTGTLTSASTVTIPDALEKFYIIDLSAVVGVTNLTIKTVSGTGFTAGEAAIVAAYSDGTNLNEIALNTLGGTIATAQIADNAITTAKISDNQITTAKISDNQITTAKVSDLQITTAKIADDAVTADKLANTAVTAGDYTATALTVDAQGRITSASSGAAGGAGVAALLIGDGPASGTFTPPAGTDSLTAIMSSGGGGSGGGGPSNTGGGGGEGLTVLATGSVAAPFSQPYSIGAGGNLGNFPGGSGGAGGATSIANFATVNGGNGGGAASPNSTGSSGNPGNSSGPAPLNTLPLGFNGGFVGNTFSSHAADGRLQIVPGLVGGNGHLLVFGEES